VIWLSFSAFIQALSKVTREKDLSKFVQKCNYSALFQGFSHRVFKVKAKEKKEFCHRAMESDNNSYNNNIQGTA